MELTEYARKTFTVLAVKVNFENIKDVAKWCGGTLDTQTTKMLGTKTELPVIKVKGVGENRDKEFVATLGCYVVELNGSFRVYKEQRFFEFFENIKVLTPKNTTPVEEENDDTDDVIDPENIELKREDAIEIRIHDNTDFREGIAG